MRGCLLYFRDRRSLARVHSAKNHSPRISLQNAGHGNRDLLSHRGAALLYHDHGPVVKVAHPLPHLVSRLNYPYVQNFAGKRHGLHRVGDFVQIDNVNALKLGNLVQVVIVRHDPGTQGLGENYQPFVYLVHSVKFGQVCLMHLKLYFGVRLHPLQNVQPPPAAVPF